MKKFIDKVIIFAFSNCLRKCGYKVIKVKGWGLFLVEGKGIPRRTVWFKWYEGFI